MSKLKSTDEIKKLLDRLSHEQLSEVCEYIVVKLGDGQATDALRYIKGVSGRWRTAFFVTLTVLCALTIYAIYFVQ